MTFYIYSFDVYKCHFLQYVRSSFTLFTISTFVHSLYSSNKLLILHVCFILKAVFKQSFYFVLSFEIFFVLLTTLSKTYFNSTLNIYFLPHSFGFFFSILKAVNFNIVLNTLTFISNSIVKISFSFNSLFHLLCSKPPLLLPHKLQCCVF